MSTKIDGKQIAAEIKTNLAERVNKLKAQGIQPGLGTLLVGEDPGSMKYVAGKHADCQEVGITSVKKELPADASFDDIAAAITHGQIYVPKNLCRVRTPSVHCVTGFRTT